MAMRLILGFSSLVLCLVFAQISQAQQLLPQLPTTSNPGAETLVALAPNVNNLAGRDELPNEVANGLPVQTKLSTRTIDLRETIAKLADKGNLTTQQARVETIQFLSLTPRKKSKRSPHDGATFELIDVDRFEITAGENFFKSLPGMQCCLEAGKVQVLVSCQILIVPISKAKRLNAFLIPDSAKVNSSVLPPVVPVATAEDAVEENASASYVTTSTITRETAPVTTGMLTEGNLKKLQLLLKNESIETMTAPKVMMYPNQMAAITDVAQRPFVVGLQEVTENRQDIVQPLVQLVEEGTTIQVRPLIRGEKIQLLSDISFSEIVDVKTVNFASAGELQQHSIQIPQQRLRQVHLSALVDNDKIMLIDPNFIQPSSPGGKRHKAEPVKIVILLKAQAIPLSSSNQMAVEIDRDELKR